MTLTGSRYPRNGNSWFDLHLTRWTYNSYFIHWNRHLAGNGRVWNELQPYTLGNLYLYELKHIIVYHRDLLRLLYYWPSTKLWKKILLRISSMAEHKCIRTFRWQDQTRPKSHNIYHCFRSLHKLERWDNYEHLSYFTFNMQPKIVCCKCVQTNNSDD